jgi:hypothetical protein
MPTPKVVAPVLALGLALGYLSVSSSVASAASYDPTNKCWGWKDHNPVWVCKKAPKKVAQKYGKKKPIHRNYVPAAPYNPGYDPYYYDYGPGYGYYPYGYGYAYPYPYYSYRPYYRPGFGLFFGFGG